MNEEQIKYLKQARLYLGMVQMKCLAYTEEYKKLDELIAEIEHLLGIE